MFMHKACQFLFPVFFLKKKTVKIIFAYNLLLTKTAYNKHNYS